MIEEVSQYIIIGQRVLLHGDKQETTLERTLTEGGKVQKFS